MGDTKELYVKIDADLYVKTGEIKPIDNPFDVNEVRKGTFQIIHDDYLSKLLVVNNCKRNDLINYLLKRKDSNNCLKVSNSELSRKIGMSRTIVVETLKLYEKENIIKRNKKIIMINPRLCLKGNKSREMMLIKQYDSFGKEK